MAHEYSDLITAPPTLSVSRPIYIYISIILIFSIFLVVEKILVAVKSRSLGILYRKYDDNEGSSDS